MPTPSSVMAPIALLSVSDKHNLLPLAKGLTKDHDYTIISSGGTAKALEEASIPVKRVADYTGAPEILGGRVKTLHPRIHGGILSKKDNPQHKNDLEQQNISHIDLVVVNLYPFRETISQPNVTWDMAIENIDIGGPAMVRAAAKNHSDVVILTRPDQYFDFLNALNKGEINQELKRKLALEAFEHTAAYDIAISQWLQKELQPNSSPWMEAIPLKQTLRYGENPHQSAAWYSSPNQGWGGAKQLQGKELSTNNLLDLEAALATVQEFGYEENMQSTNTKKSAAVVIKHTNPCGVAIESSPSKALNLALNADRTSAFGGIVALNQSVDLKTAEILTTLFLECVVAPSFEKEALAILAKKSKLRLLEVAPTLLKNRKYNHIRSVLGGVLVQDQDDKKIDDSNWKISTKRVPSEQEYKDLIFAWKVARHVRSNAIVVASNGQSIGIGAGQMNRIGAAKIALESAGEKAKNSVLASDGFFPFNDTVHIAGKYGIKAIIQPGGSIRDNDSILACNDLGITMVFTGVRHFLH
mgnify:CR=1 FL=1